MRSFDVFDTLIARRCILPTTIFEIVGHKIGAANFCRVRVEVERQLQERSVEGGYTIDDIYELLAKTAGLSAETADGIKQMELAEELDQAIPIVENLKRVSNGDLLISDMYLPRPFIRRLLTKVGLRKEVGLVVSSNGKTTGRIWPQLSDHCPVVLHLGDNERSDWQAPHAAGISAALTRVARPTPIEVELCQFGRIEIAELVRELRLANPHSNLILKQIWNLSCQLGLPLLYLASLHLLETCRNRGIDNVMFLSRDGYLWNAFWDSLFPIPSTYVYGSRQSFLFPSEDFKSYFRSQVRPNSILVDLAGSGVSKATFLEGIGCRIPLYFLYALGEQMGRTMYPGRNMPEYWKANILSFASAARFFFDNGRLECLYYAGHGRIDDVRRVPMSCHDLYLPRFSTIEFDCEYLEALHRPFFLGIQSLAERSQVSSHQPCEHSGMRLLQRLSEDPTYGAVFHEFHLAEETSHHAVVSRRDTIAGQG